MEHILSLILAYARGLYNLESVMGGNQYRVKCSLKYLTNFSYKSHGVMLEASVYNKSVDDKCLMLHYSMQPHFIHWQY